MIVRFCWVWSMGVCNTPLPKNTLTIYLSNTCTRVGAYCIRPTIIPQGMNVYPMNPQMIVRFCWVWLRGVCNTPLPENIPTIYLSDTCTVVGAYCIRPTNILQGMKKCLMNPQMIIRFCWIWSRGVCNTPLRRNVPTIYLSDTRTRVGAYCIRPTTIPQGMNAYPINPQMIVRFCWIWSRSVCNTPLHGRACTPKLLLSQTMARTCASNFPLSRTIINTSSKNLILSRSMIDISHNYP